MRFKTARSSITDSLWAGREFTRKISVGTVYLKLGMGKRYRTKLVCAERVVRAKLRALHLSDFVGHSGYRVPRTVDVCGRKPEVVIINIFDPTCGNPDSYVEEIAIVNDFLCRIRDV